MKTPSCFLLLTVVSLGLAPEVHAADYGKDPVVMVHGYFLGDTTTWTVLKSRLVEDGWPEELIFTVEFDNVFGCNPEHGETVAARVQEVLEITGRSKVDIVAHSMGALDTRYFIKYLCGYKYVKDVVMLAGANKGTTVAFLDPLSCGAQQMKVGFGDDAWEDNEFLAALNSCDQTPGDDLLYTSIWSRWDEIIIPQENSIIDGARNVELDGAFIGHGGILLNGEAYDRVKEGLNGNGLNNNSAGEGCFTLCEEPWSPEPDVVESPDDTTDSPDEDISQQPDVVVQEILGYDAVSEIGPVPDLDLESSGECRDPKCNLPVDGSGQVWDASGRELSGVSPEASEVDAPKVESRPATASGCSGGLTDAVPGSGLLVLLLLLGMGLRRVGRSC